jgi:serine/threonine protein kinase
VIRELLPKQANDRKALESFTQVIKKLRSLQLPNVPRLLGLYSREFPFFYTVEEYTEGYTLAEILQARGPFSEKETQSIGVQLLNIVEQLQSVTPPIFHGDISANNVLVRSSDQRLMLTDFGIAKDAVRTIQSNGSQVFTTDHLPAFAPPERKRGELCAATDVYMVGATLLRLLTGQELSDLYDVAQHRWVWEKVKTSGNMQLLLQIMLATQTFERLPLGHPGLTVIDHITNGQSCFDSGQFDQALTEWVKAYAVVKNPFLQARIEVARKKVASQAPDEEVRPMLQPDTPTRQAVRKQPRAPKLKFNPPNLRFVRVKKGSREKQYLEIENDGGGELSGKVISKAAWLKVTPTILDSKNRKQVITVSVNTISLADGFSEVGKIQLETNGGSAVVDVHVQVEEAPVPVAEPKTCSKCQASNRFVDKYCTKCGWDLSQPWTPPVSVTGCPKCKAENPSANKYCLTCGWELALAPPSGIPGWVKFVALGIALLITVIIIIPPSPIKRINEALDQGRLVTPIGKSESAYDLYLKWIKDNPAPDEIQQIRDKALPLLRNRGDNAFNRLHDEAQEPDWAEISRVYEWGVQLDPSDQDLKAHQQYAIGRVAFLGQRYQEALTAFQEALKYKSDWGLVYNNIGRVYVNMRPRDYYRAADYYQRAIQFDPQWCFPYANLAGVYLDQHQLDQARDYYQRAADVCPARPSVHFQLARFYDQLDHPKRPCDALLEYEKAVQLSSGQPDPGFSVEHVRQQINKLTNKCH